MANSNKSSKQTEGSSVGKMPIGRSGRRAGEAPRTTETGGQNSGGQTDRVSDKSKKNKHSGGR